MMSLLALVFLQAPRAELRAEWVVPLPAELSRPYGAMYMSPSGLQAAWPVILDDRHAVVWADSRSGRTKVLDRTAHIIEQYDCGLGLLSAQRDESTLTWDLNGGRLLSSIPHRGTRVGNLFVVRDNDTSTFTFWNVQTGMPERRTDLGYGRSQGAEPYAGTPAWDTPRKRLLIIGQGNKTNDLKDLVEAQAGGWVAGRRSFLSSYAMGFAGIVGNPERGCFAVLEQSNRAIHPTALFTKDLVRLDVSVDRVVDAGPLGLLAINGVWDEAQNLDPRELVCVAPSGVAVWHASPDEAHWIGQYALVGGRLLDGKSGKLVATLNMPEGVTKLYWSGDRAVAVTRAPTPSLVGYRLLVPD